MNKIACEEDLASDDDNIWGKALSKCQSGAPWVCNERKECVNDGECFNILKLEHALLKIDQLEEEVSRLKCNQTLFLTTFEGHLVQLDMQYQEAVKRKNEPMAWAVDFLRREMRTLIKQVKQQKGVE
ncbi:hypothetical protein QDS01_18090 [Acinetobacter nosocomialis]|uniref:hypothetical protein n=1 Tax=Acinetobacter nosocomialis TaxID=106654 RepID=UPI00244AA337|nr:hypothetical protein [Acinetobacter nosocomialis]MDH2636823.1 hypothetical protein [Acinetobacter nosocomialis]